MTISRTCESLGGHKVLCQWFLLISQAKLRSLNSPPVALQNGQKASETRHEVSHEAAFHSFPSHCCKRRLTRFAISKPQLNLSFSWHEQRANVAMGFKSGQATLPPLAEEVRVPHPCHPEHCMTFRLGHVQKWPRTMQLGGLLQHARANSSKHLSSEVESLCDNFI